MKTIEATDYGYDSYYRRSRRTTQARTGFLLRQVPHAERSLLSGKETAQCLGVTATRQNVTAREQPA